MTCRFVPLVFQGFLLISYKFDAYSYVLSSLRTGKFGQLVEIRIVKSTLPISYLDLCTVFGSPLCCDLIAIFFPFHQASHKKCMGIVLLFFSFSKDHKPSHYSPHQLQRWYRALRFPNCWLEPAVWLKRYLFFWLMFSSAQHYEWKLLLYCCPKPISTSQKILSRWRTHGAGRY